MSKGLSGRLGSLRGRPLAARLHQGDELIELLRALGFRVLGFGVLGFRVLGFWGSASNAFRRGSASNTIGEVCKRTCKGFV